jgi:hypothetical protein
VQTEGQEEEQTNTTKLKVAFRNFSNTPKNSPSLLHIQFISFVPFSQSTAIISLNVYNETSLKMATDCVLCEVNT